MATCGTVRMIPGPQGASGTNGTNGTDGVDAYTTLTAAFIMPAEGAAATATVADNSFISPGQVLYLQTCGYLQAGALTGTTQIALTNLENTATSAYTGNVAAGTVIANGSKLSIGGLQGPGGAGAAGQLLAANNLSDLANFPTSRANLGVAIGTNVQAWDADLDALAGVAATGLLARTGAGTASARTITGTAAQISVANGDGVAGDPTLSLDAGVYRAGGTDVAVADGGTGASTAVVARTNLGLTNVVIGVGYWEHQEGSGTAGGTFTFGAWRTRLLNTEVYDTGIGTLAASQVNLAAGTYRMRGWGAAYAVDNHQVRIQNITAGTTIGYGSTVRAGAAIPTEVQNMSIVEARVVLAAPSAIELQHQAATTRVTDGWGRASTFGNQEIYAGLLIEMESG